VDSAGAVLLGSQTPTYEWVPQAWTSAGQDAVEMAAACRLDLDPYQVHILDGAMGEEKDDTWTCNEAGVIIPRQNGKGRIIETRELTGLFAWGETLILHSAHEFKTSRDAFRRMKIIVESNPDLDNRLMKKSESKGEEGFEFRINGKTARLLYMARTGGAGRGFDGCNTVMLDESMILDDQPIAAMIPTMATQPRWQVWYLGSAGDIKLRSESVVLARVRRRGYRQEPGVAFFEFAAHLAHTKACPDDCVLDVRGDPRTWAKTNPAMGTRITQSFLSKLANGGMAKWDFDREFLGVGEYPNDEGWALFAEDVWGSLKDPTSSRGRAFAVGYETSWDHSVSSASIASRRADGMVHLEMIANRPGTAWIPDHARAMKKMRPCAFVVDKKGPAALIIPDLIHAKIKVVEPTLADFTAWCSKMTQLVTETHSARHLDQPTMNTAVQATTKRDTGQGGYVWERADTTADVTPWIGATMALGGLIRNGNRRGAPQVASA
jgi:hypothetical protein